MISLKGLLQSIPVFIILVLFIFYLRYFERRSLFFPSHEMGNSPKDIGLEFEDIFFNKPDDLKLNGWFVPSKDARYTIIFCHGNAGNISHRLGKIDFFHKLGCNVFIFDYRGYGRSKGAPSEKGLYNDIQGAYNYLLSRNIAPEQIIGYGESIGGAVIIDLASKNKLAAIIIDSAFTNSKDMVKIAYPYLPYWVFSSRWDSLNKIRSITVPKLMIHSINDEIVPFKLGRKLFESAPMPKEFLQVQGAHNSSYYESAQALEEKIADFLKGLSK